MKYAFLLLLCTAGYIAMAQQKITPQEATSHIGDSVTVCGKVYGGVYLQNAKDQPTLLNVGAAYPGNPFTAVVYGKSRALFTKAPEVFYVDSTVCFTGRVVEYKGKPQMIIYNPMQMNGALHDKLNTEPY